MNVSWNLPAATLQQLCLTILTSLHQNPVFTCFCLGFVWFDRFHSDWRLMFWGGDYFIFNIFLSRVTTSLLSRDLWLSVCHEDSVIHSSATSHSQPRVRVCLQCSFSSLSRAWLLNNEKLLSSHWVLFSKQFVLGFKHGFSTPHETH